MAIYIIILHACFIVSKNTSIRFIVLENDLNNLYHYNHSLLTKEIKVHTHINPIK